MSNDPFKIIEPTVISFSGGRTSAYMLHRILESNNGLPDEATICFANTGKEEEATLQFVHDCEVKWNVPIAWIEYVWHEEPSQRFKVVDFKTASRNGEPFEAVIKAKNFLPNTMMRFCTQEMKIFSINRYMKSIGKDEYIVAMGIRADEPRRVAKVSANKYGKYEKITPLADANISEQDVWDFWNDYNFDLSLPKTSGASNCDLCFLKGTKILTSLIQQKPSRADWWIQQENKIGARFSKDKPTYSEMKKFTTEQMNMFDDETIPCFCGD